MLILAATLLLTSCLGSEPLQQPSGTEAPAITTDDGGETELPNTTTGEGEPDNTEQTSSSAETENPDETTEGTSGGGLTLETDGDTREWGEVHFPQ